MSSKHSPPHKESSLLEAASELMITLDPELRIKWANKAAGDSVNEDPADLVGRHCYRVWQGRKSPCESCPARMCLQTGEPSGSEVKSPNGRHWRVRAQPLRSAEGTLEGVAELAQEITGSKEIEDALRQWENYYRTIFETTGSAMFILEQDTTISLANSIFERYSKYSREEFEGTKSWTDFVHPEDLQWMMHYHDLRRRDPGAAPTNYEFRFFDRDGELRHGYLTIDMIPGTSQSVVSLIDVTERKQAEEALRSSENHYRAIFETSGTAMFIVEEDTTISQVNSNFEELSGYLRQQTEGIKSWTEFVHPDDVAWMKENHYLRRKDPDAAPRQYEFRFITRQGEERHLLLAIDMIPGTSRSIASGIDITERKHMEEKLKEMSLYDSLTGLYNRNFFEEEMKRLSDGRHNPLGIIVCDLDGLKFVNDTLGHQSGDQMLVNIAAILRQNFRASDIIARIGGDEFAILLTYTAAESVEQMLTRLRRAVQDYNDTDPELPLSISMGHAVDEGNTADMQAFFQIADNRMYREKIQREGSARSAILQALTGTMQARDFYTEGHCDRLQELSASLARSLDLSREFVNDLYLLARFHDLGKVGISDHILFKPESLTETEWHHMRQHCEIGHRIASSVPDLEPIADYILKHHERWNGQGYPLGLSGTDIPLPCRILAIVDAYDAMTNDRPYRRAMSRQDAIAELKRCAGTQFDPDLVDSFVKLLQDQDQEKL